VVAPLAFLFLICLLWLLDFFQFSGTEASAKIVGTALTLGGGLVATMVTLMGLILRQSVEQRNADMREEAEKRLSLDAERNANLQKEAEKRLKLEAGIRAVALLGTDTGGDTSMLQRTGVLFSLARLGLPDLAIDLVRSMSPHDIIEPESIASLLDVAIRSNDRLIQRVATELLRDHSEMLSSGGGSCWPSALALLWPQEWDYFSRQNILEGMMNALLTHPRSEWEGAALNVFVVRFVIALRSEQDHRLKAPIAAVLHDLLKIYPKGTVLFLPEQDLEIDTVRREVADTDRTKIGSNFWGPIEKLKIWTGD